MADVFLDGLNAEQQSAVLDTEHNLLILASAGSGKTRVITNKIAYYIAKGIMEPYRILAVTFTNKAAKEMRDRLEKMLPDVDVTKMEIKTFHSFGLGIIRRERGKFPFLSPSFTIYDDDDSLSLLTGAFPGKDRKDLREIYRSIAKLKELGIKPTDKEVERYARTIPDFRMYFSMYQKELEKSGNVDFSDLINLPVSLFRENKEIREKYKRRFSLILVDEYQDSNKMQFELLKALYSPSSQLCVVGDDDQSIYRFRGAEIQNILTFSKSFENVREIKLEKNYRSTCEILKCADSLIAHNTERHEKSIVSATERHGAKPDLLVSENGKLEAERIAGILKRTGDYDSTAVIYRTNAQSMEFERVFSEERIPYKLVGALRFYDREEIKDSLSILSLAVNGRNGVAFTRIANKPARGIGKKALSDITALSDNYIEALKLYKENGKKKIEGVDTLIRAFSNLERDIDENVPLGNALSNSLHTLGFITLWESEKDSAVRNARSENVGALVGNLNEYGTGREKLKEYLANITLDSTTVNGDGKDDRTGVTLITMHNTKGLEFKRVFVVGLEDEIIPGRTELDEDLEEERRIFYVAITRAMDYLYLSYALNRTRWGSFQSESPSRFLYEIPEEYYSGSIVKDRFESVSTHVGDYVTPRWKPSGSTWSGHVAFKKREARFSSGMKVRSASYGTGYVLSSAINDLGEEIVRVEFPEETLSFNTRYSKLEKVLDEDDSKVDSATRYSAGDKVKSKALGTGVVKEVVNDGVNTVLVIEFSRGTVRLNKEYAKIEKL